MQSSAWAPKGFASNTDAINNVRIPKSVKEFLRHFQACFDAFEARPPSLLKCSCVTYVMHKYPIYARFRLEYAHILPELGSHVLLRTSLPLSTSPPFTALMLQNTEDCHILLECGSRTLRLAGGCDIGLLYHRVPFAVYGLATI